MSNHYYPSNADRANMGRDLLADFATQTRGLPGDRDLHERGILVENAQDAITYLFHALAEADIDIAAFAESCIEDWKTDLAEEDADNEEALSEVAEQTETFCLLPGAAGSSLYPDSRTEWWWAALEDEDVPVRFSPWPIGMKRMLVAGLVNTETKSMQTALRLAAANEGLAVPRWEPGIALTAVTCGQETHWPPQRLHELFAGAHRTTVADYPAIEAAAAVSYLNHLEAEAARKGWALDVAEQAAAHASGKDDTAFDAGPPPAAPDGQIPAWRQTGGHWELQRDLTDTDAQLLTGLADAIAALEPDRHNRR
ncbi:hypothetical protein GCM10029992_36510 [Glycomyces albus]